MCSPLQQSTIYIYILEQYGESTAIDEQLITYITIEPCGGNVAVIHTYLVSSPAINSMAVTQQFLTVQSI